MKKAELEHMVEELSIDPIWKCYTRAALQLRWSEFSKNAVGIAYCDIDDMHGLNAKFGHSGTDNRIMFVIENIRCDDIVASRWLNGNKLIFILEIGIRGTFAYSDTLTECPVDTINPLDTKVQRSKNLGKKGVILS